MSQKHVIITGASRGIGAETALYLAGKGVTVTAIARSGDKLQALQKNGNRNIHPLTVDITSKDAGKKILNHLKENNLKIDGLIHNAGVLINKPFSKQSDEDWELQIAVNLLAPARITRDLLPMMEKGSHIVTNSSMGGFQGSSKFPGLSAYSAVKGGLAILSECLAEELADRNVSCNSLCLGAVQTEMLNEAFPGVKAPLSPEEMGEYMGEFVLSGHKYYNGQVLPVTLGNPG